MDVIRTPDEMRAWTRGRRESARRVGLVPTMGALHDGHASLISRSTEADDATVVSVFVNPTQFNRQTDFDLYPRTEADDFAMCDCLGVDAVYAPSAEVMYPSGSSTIIDPGPLAHVLEGASRAGHFAGVATVVVKLLMAVEPDVAYFGEKDLQQVAVVTRVVSDLDLAVTISAQPTVRETDGLAMSSRNVRLTAQDRAAATCIPHALSAVRDAVKDGNTDVTALRAMMHQILRSEPRCTVDYAEIVDRHSFTPVDTVDDAAAACIAAWFGDVRLIDNLVLSNWTGV